MQFYWITNRRTTDSASLPFCKYIICAPIGYYRSFAHICISLAFKKCARDAACTWSLLTSRKGCRLLHALISMFLWHHHRHCEAPLPHSFLGATAWAGARRRRARWTSFSTTTEKSRKIASCKSPYLMIPNPSRFPSPATIRTDTPS